LKSNKKENLEEKDEMEGKFLLLFLTERKLVSADQSFSDLISYTIFPSIYIYLMLGLRL
jgi:hypothetical protein